MVKMVDFNIPERHKKLCSIAESKNFPVEKSAAFDKCLSDSSDDKKNGGYPEVKLEDFCKKFDELMEKFTELDWKRHEKLYKKVRKDRKGVRLTNELWTVDCLEKVLK